MFKQWLKLINNFLNVFSIGDIYWIIYSETIKKRYVEIQSLPILQKWKSILKLLIKIYIHPVVMYLRKRNRWTMQWHYVVLFPECNCLGISKH